MWRRVFMTWLGVAILASAVVLRFGAHRPAGVLRVLAGVVLVCALMGIICWLAGVANDDR